MENELRQLIRAMIEDVLGETSTTAATPGYSTPNAFTGKKYKKEKLKRLKDRATQLGFSMVDDLEDSDDLSEVSFDNTLMNKVLSDYVDFLKSEARKIGKTPLDVYELIEKIIPKDFRFFSKIK